MRRLNIFVDGFLSGLAKSLGVIVVLAFSLWMLACSETARVDIVPQRVTTTVTTFTKTTTPLTAAFRECSHDGAVYKQSPLEPCRAGDKEVGP